MSVSVTLNNTSYTIPTTNETGWGSNVTSWIQAVSNSTLQLNGGTFTLTADTDFGANFGLKSLYYKSRNASPSSAGIIRLGSAESVGWRNFADSGNLLLTTDSSDNLVYNGHILSSSSGIVPVADGGTGLSSYTSGDMIYATGSTVLAKLAIGSSNQAMFVTAGAPSWGTLPAAGGGTGQSSYTTGDSLYASGSSAISKLAIGTTGQAKIVSGGLPAWGTVPVAGGGTGQTSYTTGDLPYASSSSAISKLGIGSTGQVLKVAGGLPAWGAAGSSLSVVAKTTTYTILSTDDYISGNTSGGGFTMTLPDNATNAGKVYYIEYIDSGFANALTIARAGSDTIEAATSTTLNTQGEVLELLSNGSGDWKIISRRVPSIWIAYSLSITGSGSNPTKGTIVTDSALWRRIGDSAEITYRYQQSATGSNGTGNYLFSLPGALAINTSKMTVSSTYAANTIGSSSYHDGNATNQQGHTQAYDSTHLALGCASTSTSAYAYTLMNATNGGLGNVASIYLSFRAVIPISGWNG